MDLLLWIVLALFFAPQANALPEQEYCLGFANSSYTNQSSTSRECHDLCVKSKCFGHASDECYECRHPDQAVEIDVQELCQNILDMNYTYSVYNCSEPAQDDRTRIIIIAASAGGGGALLLLLLLLLLCCCCCCCIRRNRKTSYVLQGGADLEVPIVAVETADRDLNRQHDTISEKNKEKNEFSMQLNVALCDDPLSPAPVSTSFMNTTTTTTAASNPSHRMLEDQGTNKRNSPNPATMAAATLGDTGYVAMSSAGSIRDLTAPDPDDQLLYEEPDQTAAALLLARSPTSPTHSKDKPATLPKPVTLATQAHDKFPLQQVHPRAQKPLSVSSPRAVAAASSTTELKLSARGQDLVRSDSQSEDDYESPKLFQHDLKKQQGYRKQNPEDPDEQTLYANMDSLKPEDDGDEPSNSSTDKARCLTPENPDEQTLYANVDPLKPTEESNHSSYEKVGEFLHHEGPGGGGGSNRGSALYYNVPDLGGAGVEDDNDNMYVYMKSGQTNIDTSPPASAKVERRRMQSENVGKQDKKYVNFSREQQIVSGLEDIASRAGAGAGGQEEAPIYANCTEEEELYTAMS